MEVGPQRAVVTETSGQVVDARGDREHPGVELDLGRLLLRLRGVAGEGRGPLLALGVGGGLEPVGAAADRRRTVAEEAGGAHGAAAGQGARGGQVVGVGGGGGVGVHRLEGATGRDGQDGHAHQERGAGEGDRGAATGRTSTWRRALGRDAGLRRRLDHDRLDHERRGRGCGENGLDDEWRGRGCGEDGLDEQWLAARVRRGPAGSPAGPRTGSSTGSITTGSLATGAATSGVLCACGSGSGSTGGTGAAVAGLTAKGTTSARRARRPTVGASVKNDGGTGGCALGSARRRPGCLSDPPTDVRLFGDLLRGMAGNTLSGRLGDRRAIRAGTEVTHSRNSRGVGRRRSASLDSNGSVTGGEIPRGHAVDGRRVERCPCGWSHEMHARGRLRRSSVSLRPWLLPRPRGSASWWPNPASTATTAAPRSSPGRCGTPDTRSSTRASTRPRSRSSRPRSRRTPT